MILTTCAACAAPLAHNAPRCIRCHTRYCNKTCQHDHWRRGHKQICKRIHRGGNAEQYYADKKYKEAVAVAVEACAADTKGQKCYICLEAVHPHTGEGLVRGCACGDRDGVSSPELGVAHVSCLARQAKELVAEVEENKTGNKAHADCWARWRTCVLCEQQYHGVVQFALGWACWKTYLGRPETDRARAWAMSVLGSGLDDAGHHEDALAVQEAELSLLRRLRASEKQMLVVQSNLSTSYANLGRIDDSLRMDRAIYASFLRLYGVSHGETLNAALNLSITLYSANSATESKTLTRQLLPLARRALGADNDTCLRLAHAFVIAVMKCAASSRDEFVFAERLLDDTARRFRRVLGIAHPGTARAERDLALIRERLAEL